MHLSTAVLGKPLSLMATHPTLNPSALETLGLSKRDWDVYVALLALGQAPLRRIAEAAGVSRGTAYDVLKSLMRLGIVNYVDTKRHRHFTADDPQALQAIVAHKESAVEDARNTVARALPGLRAMVGSQEHRPTVRYCEGERGVRQLLEDVLEHSATAPDRGYRLYSSALLRDPIRAAWPGFSKTRVERHIAVRTIAIGEGGRTYGLDERKWLTEKESAPTYVFLYGRKTAYVSQDAQKGLFGVIIEDAGIAQTQQLIFDKTWRLLS